MTEELKKFTVRMPSELYERLKNYSEKSYIPMSRLILIAVDEYLKNSLSQDSSPKQSNL